MSYTISDLVASYLASDRNAQSQRQTPTGRQYRALCSAFGVPVDWEEDQIRRQHSLNGAVHRVEEELLTQGTVVPQICDVTTYLWPHLTEAEKEAGTSSRYYMRFREALQGSFNHGDGGARGFYYPLEQKVDIAIREVYQSLRRALLEVDVLFFEGVYHIDARKTFSGEDLMAYGAASPEETLDYNVNQI
ncbi:hypothetical protein AB4Y45_34865 [Paraburkholderia sp. EG287A]|uniref:hypothetical protein n=1 Tax=Paraburkholderia sp. EG287A TaxID=3237012 RepID=UPI0034D2D2B7